MKKKIFDGLIFGIISFFTIISLYLVYASGFNLPSTVGTGSGLSSTEWNKIVSSLDDLNTRVNSLSTGNGNMKAFVSFDGTICSPNCQILSGNNISSVVRNSTGDYTINFTNPMTDNKYAVIGSLIGTTGTRGGISEVFSKQIPNTINSTYIVIRDLYSPNNYPYRDFNVVNVAIFR